MKVLTLAEAKRMNELAHYLLETVSAGSPLDIKRAEELASRTHHRVVVEATRERLRRLTDRAPCPKCGCPLEFPDSPACAYCNAGLRERIGDGGRCLDCGEDERHDADCPYLRSERKRIAGLAGPILDILTKAIEPSVVCDDETPGESDGDDDGQYGDMR